MVFWKAELLNHIKLEALVRANAFFEAKACYTRNADSRAEVVVMVVESMSTSMKNVFTGISMSIGISRRRRRIVVVAASKFKRATLNNDL